MVIISAETLGYRNTILIVDRVGFFQQTEKTRLFTLEFLSTVLPWVSMGTRLGDKSYRGAKKGAKEAQSKRESPPKIPSTSR